jgi:hypothetical protein
VQDLDRLRLLKELAELLEGVETFGSIDYDKDAAEASTDEKSPERAREIVAALIAGAANAPK